MALRLTRAARLLAGCAVIGGASFSFAVAAEAGTGARAHTYRGFAFDTCSAPSVGALRAWRHSPFKALNIYIGGGDRACAQPNLSARWVRAALGMGWRLIPTYVSLQAPRPSCRCDSMNPYRANMQGVAAANNAVRAAVRLGIGRGNPIYDDMEGYNVNRRNTNAVMAFLEGWTGRLHGLGYVSGVYSSSASGIANLVWRVGRGFIEPNQIWIADWNRRATADDPFVPPADWSHNQRIHQYRGQHTDRFGGVRISIDSNFCRGAVVAPGTLGPLRF